MFVIRFLVFEVAVLVGTLIAGALARLPLTVIALLSFGMVVAMQMILLAWIAFAANGRVRPRARRRARQPDRIIVTEHGSLLP